MSLEEEKVVSEEVPADDWDKKKQEIDQAIASGHKKAEEAYAGALEGANAELADLKTQMAEIKASQADKKDEISTLDPDLVDRNIIVEFQRGEVERKELQKQIQELRSIAKKYEDEQAKAETQAEGSRLREEILSDCDGRFGAEHRNAALAMADELVDSGKEKQPKSQWAGFKLMEKCYKQVIEKAEKGKKDDTPQPLTDDGLGGIAFDEDKVISGSLNDVLDDMKKTGDWKRR